MCKHILINKFEASDLKHIESFIEMTNERDGYGAIMRLKDGSIETLKALNDAIFYLYIGQWINSDQIETLVIHHRTSTNGDGIDYAHPFEFQGKYMTHNGVVTVPGKHDTKTTNDSEALLHHLIKSEFDTKSISGYFSCFILDGGMTTVLVDDTAPMYTDGRVYCSHNLGKGFNKIKLCKIDLDTMGQVISTNPIEVTKTNYGMDKAYLSLGYKDNVVPMHNAFETESDYGKDWHDETSFFIDCLNANEWFKLSNCKDIEELSMTIDRIAWDTGTVLTETQKDYLVRFFQEERLYTGSW